MDDRGAAERLRLMAWSGEVCATAAKRGPDRFHPLLTRWLLCPATPGPPLSDPSWPRRAGACRRVEVGWGKVKFDCVAAQPSVCLQKNIHTSAGQRWCS